MVLPREPMKSMVGSRAGNQCFGFLSSSRDQFISSGSEVQQQNRQEVKEPDGGTRKMTEKSE